MEKEIFKTRRNKDQEFRRRNREKKRRNSVSVCWHGYICEIMGSYSRATGFPFSPHNQ